MFFWNSLAFLVIQQLLAIWFLVSLGFLNPAWTSGSSCFTYYWSLAWRILSIHLLMCEMNAIPSLSRWKPWCSERLSELHWVTLPMSWPAFRPVLSKGSKSASGKPVSLLLHASHGSSSLLLWALISRKIAGLIALFVQKYTDMFCVGVFLLLSPKLKSPWFYLQGPSGLFVPLCSSLAQDWSWTSLSWSVSLFSFFSTGALASFDHSY